MKEMELCGAQSRHYAACLTNAAINLVALVHKMNFYGFLNICICITDQLITG